MYLTQSLHRMVRQAPLAIAAIDREGQWTWAELRSEVARFGGALRAMGVRPGEPVAILGRNSRVYLRCFLGTLWAGGVVNPVNIRWSAREIAAALDDCGARFLLCDPEFAAIAGQVQMLRAQPGAILSNEEGWLGAPGVSKWLERADFVDDMLRHGDDLAALLYTGGTTGLPKGVMLSHANLLSSALGALACPGMTPGPRYLHSAPLYHVGGISGLLMALLTGSTHIFLPQFEGGDVMRAIRDHGVTDAFLVPTMMQMLLADKGFAAASLPSLRRIRYGASPIAVPVLESLMQRFSGLLLSQAYGMTELSPVATILTPEDHRTADSERLRSAGRPTPVTDIRVVDEKERDLPVGAIGEVLVRGPQVMRGYWNRPDLTAEVLRGGWMHTGDLGFMDGQGYLTVVDRLKDMIVSGGENVYSSEVENVLMSYPAVAACAVIGMPDPQWGEAVMAFVVLRAGQAPDIEAVRRHCRASIAGYKVPRRIEWVASLPLTAAGKVDKAALRRAAPEDSMMGMHSRIDVLGRPGLGKEEEY